MPNNLCCRYSSPTCQCPISCNQSLKAHYDYWDRFVQEWIEYNIICTSPNWKDYSTLKEWAYPKFNNDCTPFNKGLNDPTIHYLPEPWWGNDGTHPLHSVIINFNPGNGGKVQYNNDLNNSEYSAYVNAHIRDYISYIQRNPNQKIPDNKDFLQTCDWHYSRRAKWIYEAITPIYGCSNYQLSNNLSLHNHLSVELIPWHSKSATSDFHKYVASNRNAIFEHSVKFAAEASKCINNPTLRNVVIVRMSSSAFKQCLGGIGGLNYLIQEVKIDAGIYCIFEFTTIPNVIFVCIWGEHSQNAFPSKASLAKILNEVAIYKLSRTI